MNDERDGADDCGTSSSTKGLPRRLCHDGDIEPESTEVDRISCGMPAIVSQTAAINGPDLVPTQHTTAQIEPPHTEIDPRSGSGRHRGPRGAGPGRRWGRRSQEAIDPKIR